MTNTKGTNITGATSWIPTAVRGLVFGVSAAAAIGAGSLSYAAIASAEAVWDIEAYDDCMSHSGAWQMDRSINDQRDFNDYCCRHSGGIFVDDGYTGKCVAPPAEPAKGSRQLPGDVQIPSDIATAPGVTKAPLRPIRVPTDIATAPA